MRLHRLPFVLVACAALGAEDVTPLPHDGGPVAPVVASQPGGDVTTSDALGERVARFAQMHTDHGEIARAATARWDAALAAARRAQAAVIDARGRGADQDDIDRLSAAADHEIGSLDRLCDELDARVRLAELSSRWDTLVADHPTVSTGEGAVRYREALAAATTALDALAAALATGNEPALLGARHASEIAELRLGETVAHGELEAETAARREAIATLADAAARRNITEHLTEVEQAAVAALDEFEESERSALKLRHDSDDLAARAEAAQQQVEAAQQRASSARERMQEIDEALEQARELAGTDGERQPTQDPSLPNF